MLVIGNSGGPPVNLRDHLGDHLVGINTAILSSGAICPIRHGRPAMTSGRAPARL